MMRFYKPEEYKITFDGKQTDCMMVGYWRTSLCQELLAGDVLNQGFRRPPCEDCELQCSPQGSPTIYEKREPGLLKWQEMKERGKVERIIIPSFPDSLPQWWGYEFWIWFPDKTIKWKLSTSKYYSIDDLDKARLGNIITLPDGTKMYMNRPLEVSETEHNNNLLTILLKRGGVSTLTPATREEVEIMGSRLTKATREEVEKAVGQMKAVVKESAADTQKGISKGVKGIEKVQQAVNEFGPSPQKRRKSGRPASFTEEQQARAFAEVKRRKKNNPKQLTHKAICEEVWREHEFDKPGQNGKAWTLETFIKRCDEANCPRRTPDSELEEAYAAMDKAKAENPHAGNLFHADAICGTFGLTETPRQFLARWKERNERLKAAKAGKKKRLKKSK